MKEWKAFALVFAVLGILVVAGIGGAFVVSEATGGASGVQTTTTSGHDHGSHDHGQTTTQERQTVDENKVPAPVRESKPGAQAMAEALRNGDYQELRVFIKKQNGEVVVTFISDAQSGTGLKEDLRGVAYEYSDVVGEYSETGGLTVHANGVEMLVSQDTALAHSNESINDGAFNKTFVFKSSQARTTTEGK